MVYGQVLITRASGGVTLGKDRRSFDEARTSVDKIVFARSNGMSNTVLFELDIIVLDCWVAAVIVLDVLLI